MYSDGPIMSEPCRIGYLHRLISKEDREPNGLFTMFVDYFLIKIKNDNSRATEIRTNYLNFDQYKLNTKTSKPTRLANGTCGEISACDVTLPNGLPADVLHSLSILLT